jgi:hypothetical protein
LEVRSIEIVSAVKDAAGQPGIRTGGLVRRDPAVDNPGSDAASVIDEATADGVQFKVVQLSMLSIAALSHLCFPLFEREDHPLLINGRENIPDGSLAP